MNTAQDTIRDLIADARFSRRKLAGKPAGWDKGEEIYLAQTLERISNLFHRRHTAWPDRYGIFSELNN